MTALSASERVCWPGTGPENGKMYRPAGGGMDWDWREETLSVGEVCGRMDVSLYFLHMCGFPYAVPSEYQPDQDPSDLHRATGSRSGDTPNANPNHTAGSIPIRDITT